RVVRDAAFNHDGTRLVTVGGDGTVTIWDTTTGQVLRRLESPVRDAARARFSANAQRIALAGPGSGRGQVWDIATGQGVMSLLPPDGPIVNLALDPAGTRLAIASRQGAVTVWDVATGTMAFRRQGNLPGFRSVAFSPDGTWLAAGSEDKSVIVWDAATGQE